MTTQLELETSIRRHNEGMSYPQVPGSKINAPETSAQAGADLKLRAGTLRALCHGTLSMVDMTADEVADVLGESVLSIRPRFSELRRMGRITPTEQRRKNASGHSAVVWRAK